MRKKGSSKWFSPLSAVKFYGGLLVGLLCLVHSAGGFISKSFDEIIEFNLLSGSPIMTLVLAVVCFAFARNSFIEQRW